MMGPTTAHVSRRRRRSAASALFLCCTMPATIQALAFETFRPRTRIPHNDDCSIPAPYTSPAVANHRQRRTNNRNGNGRIASSSSSKCPWMVITNRFVPHELLRREESSHEDSHGSTTATSLAAIASTESSSSTSPHSLSALDSWCASHLDAWYHHALARKCPFFRRRATDGVDLLDQVTRTFVWSARSRQLVGPPLSLRGVPGANTKAYDPPSWEQLLTDLRHDWCPDTRKGYYVTGRLSTRLYRDDCLFDGPDPDMPVRGLRKFVNAASALFCPRDSSCELRSLKVVEQVGHRVRQLRQQQERVIKDDASLSSSAPSQSLPYQFHVIVARWRFRGRLRLPWRPTLPTVEGTTTYHLDDRGLIYLHREVWDISVAQAFWQTFWPWLGRRLWPGTTQEDGIAAKTSAAVARSKVAVSTQHGARKPAVTKRWETLNSTTATLATPF